MCCSTSGRWYPAIFRIDDTCWRAGTSKNSEKLKSHCQQISCYLNTYQYVNRKLSSFLVMSCWLKSQAVRTVPTWARRGMSSCSIKLAGFRPQNFGSLTPNLPECVGVAKEYYCFCWYNTIQLMVLIIDITYYHSYYYCCFLQANSICFERKSWGKHRKPRLRPLALQTKRHAAQTSKMWMNAKKPSLF